jgi:hypothetical protein
MKRHYWQIGIFLALAGCSTNPTLGGGGGNVASGAAGGSNAVNANSQLEHCVEPLGTVTIDEDETQPWYAYLSQYHLPSTVPLLRLMVQQSNCFVIVDRGRGLNSAMGERALQQSGEVRKSNTFGKGKIVTADYTMSPSVNFSQQGTSGIGGAVASFVPVFGGAVGALAGGAHSNDASTTLLLIDNRSTVQIAAAQGSARNWDIGGLGGLFSYGGGGAVGGYSSTPEGKIITAAFLDSYNEMVQSLRSYKAQEVKGGLGNGGSLGVGN